jgi:hypothetical protein
MIVLKITALVLGAGALNSFHQISAPISFSPSSPASHSASAKGRPRGHAGWRFVI